MRLIPIGAMRNGAFAMPLMARPLKQSVWGDDRPDPYFENRRFRNEDAVIVELARPVRWQDAESGQVILFGGKFERK